MLTDLNNGYRFVLAVVAFFIVAFGQPAWSSSLGALAALMGYALIGRVVISYSRPLSRFLVAGAWYFAVQLVQLSWFISHPYAYIYIVYVGMSLILGVQFGWVGILMTPCRLRSLIGIIAIPSAWVVLEWSRLFILSGFSWNPSGLILTGNIFSLQLASLWGVFGLSFWVLLVNLLGLRAWLLKAPLSYALWMVAALLPYAYGYAHILLHEYWMEEEHRLALRENKSPYFSAILVQPAFPVELTFDWKNPDDFVACVMQKWTHILKITKKHSGNSVDLIALPEFLVPFGTYSFVYPYEKVAKSFEEILGKESIRFLPPLGLPFATQLLTDQGPKWFVNNAFWTQALSNYFNSNMVVGLEDVEETQNGREYYSAALFFQPMRQLLSSEKPRRAERYAKRILVPMGEYIPFAFCRELAARYGVNGSFKEGLEAKILTANKLSFGVCICYEETFGYLTRENRQLGANLLVNLTSDAWFPSSRLPQQHFDHARLRTVENGVPLIRACNTGVTGSLDSLGRLTGKLGNTLAEIEEFSDSILVHVPTYHYRTLYTLLGDKLIIGFCFFVLLCLGIYEYKHRHLS
ncbi:apolipoprotein N-acyltransferase [Parachlamydia sp. AcF125]|uniref:apolipoprotein N-acyltransferase n=1 Tax=Parachlamydia sp. AcF125 TaxID=2795736 RepID=UPI001BCA121C|nr:apolipoprotein N-acyltransferase [Parachlamydia sp. AcF125]MBS4167462.1 Apolipoprotein N-acyltransferase [Parachlamydia sp. AcF125]